MRVPPHHHALTRETGVNVKFAKLEILVIFVNSIAREKSREDDHILKETYPTVENSVLYLY